MRKALSFVFAGFLFFATAFAQQTLDNASIIKLVGSGLSEDLIVNIVQTQNGNYALIPDDIIALKKAGVSEKIISAMIAKGPSGTVSPRNEALPSALPDEVGVYLNQKGNWVQFLPEVVNWQTGGVVKHIGTLGVVKGDVNGKLYGAHSKTSLPIPVQILFRLPEGTEITEYQLIHCHEHRSSREFRTVTGGVFHVSGGAKRDLLPFDFKKVANRAFIVELSDLQAGEYGFVAPGAAMQSHASAQLGKMYTFQVLE